MIDLVVVTLTFKIWFQTIYISETVREKEVNTGQGYCLAGYNIAALTWNFNIFNG